MTAETLTPKPKSIEPAERTILREEFGPGKAGDWAFQVISSGASCETFIDADKNKCGDAAIGTVDVDIRGELDVFPYCSPEHGTLLEQQLVADIEASGGFTYPGRNGFGRA